MKFYLATGSPRRQEIFRNFFSREYTVIPHRFTEADVPRVKNPVRMVKNITQGKLQSVLLGLSAEPYTVVAADTIVYYKHRVYGKPENEEDAYRMLADFSGHRIRVYTAVGVYSSQHSSMDFCVEKTIVHFRRIGEEEIKGYVRNPAILDMAGGFGIQHAAAFFIKKIDGDFFNVVGLPVFRTYRMLQNIIPGWKPDATFSER